jgi:hypothetical protein
MDFTIRYDSGERKFEGLEHYYGAQSLFGITQVLLISLNAFFNREILTQAPSARGFKVIPNNLWRMERVHRGRP